MGRGARPVDHDGVAQGRDLGGEPAPGSGGRRLTPTRIEWTPAEAEALGRAFAASYWLLALLFAVGALVTGRYEALLAVGVFAVVLLVWQRTIRRPGGWVLVVDPHELAVETGGGRRSVRRDEVVDVRWKRRATRGAAYWELRAVGTDGKPVWRESVADHHRHEVVAALAAHGWPS